ncbi:mechanosensitive ion channel family protein [bacterium]|nr:MAG: mechanosensitive ion channel family protein [bacterium]
MCLLGGWLVSKILTRLIVVLVQLVAVQADEAPTKRAMQLRRVETYLGIVLAFVRVLTITVVGFVGWRLLAPDSSSSVAAIGIGTIFAVISGGTIIPLLRDITAGSAMIAERWFTVGDFIRIEPFPELGGVVEALTLRSTKLRGLNGEVIWLHNQHIQAVRITPRGLRTIRIDLFVRDVEAARQLIERASATLPTGTTAVMGGVKIVQEEQVASKRSMLIVEGQTPPGREWLLETYFIETLLDLDRSRSNTEAILTRKPIVRYIDAAAEKSFKRAVRTK